MWRPDEDVRYAARSLRRHPGFSISVILVLALGIGANTAVFSVARNVILRPLPYPEPDRLAQYISRTQTGIAALASIPKYNQWRGSLRIHETITAYHGDGPGVTLVDGDRREHIRAIYATASYFEVFHAPIQFGRVFSRQEDVPQGPNVTVISHALATRRFGAQTNPVGRLLRLGDAQYEIVGVLGAAFEPRPHADIWLPLQTPHVSFDHTNYLTVVARLKPHVKFAAADRELADTTVPFHRVFPDTTGPYEQFGAEPLEHMVAGDSRDTLRVLSGAVVLVLLIGCANAANLFIARAARRRSDLATRAALGAGRGRLVRQLFAECALLALAAGVTGLGLGYVGVRALIAAAPPSLAAADVSVDAELLQFTLLISGLTAIVFGLLPALRASRVDLTSALKDSISGNATPRGQTIRQSILVIAEITIAVVLLVGSGLLVRTFLELRSVDRGFRSNGLLTLEMPLNDGAFATGPAVDALVRNVRHRLDDITGPRRVAATYSLPLETTMSLPFTIVERPLYAAPYHGVGDWRSVTPGYFDVLQIPLVFGRAFADTDDSSAPAVVIINRSMARRFWQDQDPIGQRISVGRPGAREFDSGPRLIVGVVGNVRDSAMDVPPEPMMYVPIAQTGDRMMARNNRFFALTWIVRSDERATVRQDAERALRDASGGLPIARVQPIEDILRAATAQLEFTTLLLAAFAAAALLLASVGLSGLMAYSVEERRQEIGIRLALGAEPAALRNMVLAQGGRLTTIGIVAGLTAAWLLSQMMASVVVGMAAWDATVFAAVAALLAMVSMAAAYFPAQDATRTDPLHVLRRS